MVGLLLVLGARRDDRSHAGNRAFMLAVAYGHKEAVERLSRGTDLGKDRITVLDLATKREHREVCFRRRVSSRMTRA
jgi:hypothetical protein